MADFIGDTNLLSGTMVGGHIVVDGAEIPLHSGAEVIPGEKAYLSIRPEMVTVHTGARAPGDGARPSLEGTVEETIFMGSLWKTIVRLPGGSRIVASEPPSSHRYIAPGTAVSVVWDAERAVLLPE